jgi:hypothetical protein
MVEENGKCRGRGRKEEKD